MKRKSIALYDPYLDTLGGGEKHILSILKALAEKDYEINIFWNENLENKIKSRFRIQFADKLKFLPNNFKNQSLTHSLKTLYSLRIFDYFFYVTDGSYFLSSAKKNFVFCMVPNKNLYRLGLKNKLKTLNYHFITNSKYTHSWLHKWGIKSNIIYPYLEKEFIDMPLNKQTKQKIILSVGRFYDHLHSKKQSVIINWFNKLKRSNSRFKDFSLVIAGGLKQEDGYYFNKLKGLIKNKNEILLRPNITFNELFDLYKRSFIYIHMTGYGIDENKYPESVEHLGISPLEAMASGCLTFCYDAGGPKEIIKSHENGFLFKNLTELDQQIVQVLTNANLQSQIRLKAKKFVVDNFNYSVFAKRVKEVLL